MKAWPLSAVRRTAVALIGVATGALIAPLSVRADAPTRLYHRFETRAIGQWASLTLPLRPGAWRVGAEDGPFASAEQLRAVMSAACGLAIGARCRGIARGSTHYPCEVELSQPAWQGLQPGARTVDIALWQANAGGTLVRYDNSSVVAASWGGEVAGAIAPVAAGSHKDLVSLLAPAQFMVGSAMHDGTVLQFRLRLSYSPLAKPPGAFRPEGWVILSIQPFEEAAAPELPMSGRQLPAPGQPI